MVKQDLDLISEFLLKQAGKKIHMFEAVQDGRVYDLHNMLDDYNDDDCKKILLNWKAKDGRTLLHIACFYGQIKCTNQLLRYHIKYKVNVYALDDFCYTPFDLACICGFSNVGKREGLYDILTIQNNASVAAREVKLQYYFVAELRPMAVCPEMPLNITITIINNSKCHLDIIKITAEGKFLQQDSVDCDTKLEINTYIQVPMLFMERQHVEDKYVDYTDESGSYNQLKELPELGQLAFYNPPNSLEVGQEITFTIKSNPHFSPNKNIEKFIIDVNNNQIDCTRIIDGFERTHRFLILEQLLEADEIIHNYPMAQRYNQGSESKLKPMNSKILPSKKKGKLTNEELTKKQEKDQKKCCKFDKEAFIQKVQGIFHLKNKDNEHCNTFTGTKNIFKRNSCLHWTIYNADFASTYLVFMLNANLILYKNEDDWIPFDMALLFFQNHNISDQDLTPEVKRYYDMMWIVECLIEESIVKVPERVYGVDNWKTILENYLYKKYYKDNKKKSELDHKKSEEAFIKEVRDLKLEEHSNCPLSPELNKMSETKYIKSYSKNQYQDDSINKSQNLSSTERKKHLLSYSDQDFAEIHVDCEKFNKFPIKNNGNGQALKEVVISEEHIETPKFSPYSSADEKIDEFHKQTENNVLGFELNKDDEEDQRAKKEELQCGLGLVKIKVSEKDNKPINDLFSSLGQIVQFNTKDQEKIPESNIDTEKLDHIEDQMKKKRERFKQAGKIKSKNKSQIIGHMLSELTFARCEFRERLVESEIAAKGVFSSKWNVGQDLVERLKNKQEERRKTAEFIKLKRREEIDKYLEEFGQPKNVQIRESDKTQIKSQKLHRQNFGLKLNVINHETGLTKMTTAENFLNKFFFWLVVREFYSQALIFMESYNCTPFMNITDNINTQMYAMKAGNKDLVKFQLDQTYICQKTGNELSKMDIIKFSATNDYNTPLHFAMMNQNYEVACYLMKVFSYEINKRKVREHEDDEALKIKIEKTVEHCFDPTSVKWKEYIPVKKERPIKINEKINLRGVKPYYEDNLNTGNLFHTTLFKTVQQKKSKTIRKLKHEISMIYKDKLSLFTDTSDEMSKIRKQFNKIMKNWLYCVISKSCENNIHDDILHRQLMNIQQKYKEFGAFDYFHVKICNHDQNSNADSTSGQEPDIEYVWLLNIDDKLAFHFCTKLGLKLYHQNKKMNKEKHPNDKADEYEQLRDWIRIEIIQFLLREEFDQDDYVLTGIVKDHFTMHNFSTRKMLLKYLKKYWKNLAFICTPFRDANSLAPVNLCALYFGVQPAYYLVFNVVIAVWLIPVSFLALVQFIISLIIGETNNVSLLFYNQFISIWSLFLFRIWKRLENTLTYIWDMNEIENTKRALYSFRGYFSVDKKSGLIKKKDAANRIQRRIIINFLLVSLGSAMIIFTFVSSISVSDTIKNDYADTNYIHYNSLLVQAGSMNGILIFLCEIIYTFLQTGAQYIENHEYQENAKNSLIVKSFCFQFVISYISLFYYAFIEQNFEVLSGNLLSLVITKQGLTIVKLNVLPWLQYRYNFKKFSHEWKKIYVNHKKHILSQRVKDIQDKTFDQLGPKGKQHVAFLELELALLYEVKVNQIQVPAKNLSKEYEINLIILGYVAFFSAAFPLTSLIIQVMMVVKFGFDAIEYAFYSRRPGLEPQRGVSGWNIILKGICYSSVTTNVAFVFFTSKGLEKLIGAYNDQDETDKHNLIILFFVEHIVLWSIGLIKELQPDMEYSISNLTESEKYAQSRDKIQVRDNLAAACTNLDHLKCENNTLKLKTGEVLNQINTMTGLLTDVKQKDISNNMFSSASKLESSLVGMRNNLLDANIDLDGTIFSSGFSPTKVQEENLIQKKQECSIFSKEGRKKRLGLEVMKANRNEE